MSDFDRFELVGPVRSVVTKHPQLRTIGRGTSPILISFRPTKRTQLAISLSMMRLGVSVEEQTVKPDGKLALPEVLSLWTME